MDDIHIVDKAIERLHELTGIEVHYKPQSIHKSEEDGIINIGKKPGIDLSAEIKNEIREAQIPALINQMKRHEGKFVLVTRYIPGPLKDRLKSEAVNYLETSGNCLISNGQLFVYINDQKVTPQRETGKSVLWNSAGLRFVFAVLQNPDMLNQPYREIAGAAGVALGTIGKLIENLKSENFLKEGKKNGDTILFLERKDELITRWVTLYNTTLRPKQLIGRFKAVGNTTVNDLTLPPGLLWGGEAAGAKLTKFLSPEKFTLYTALEKLQVMKILKLVPDPNGDIELLNIFWNSEIIDKEKNVAEMQIVPPLIVYADLLGSYDSRNHETAERIKSKYFEKLYSY